MDTRPSYILRFYIVRREISSADRNKVSLFTNSFKSGSYMYIYRRPIKGTFASSVDPDQTLQNAASDQVLHCLLKLQKCL